MIKALKEPKCSFHNERITMFNLEKNSYDRLMCDQCIKNKQINKVILFSKAIGINQEINKWQKQIIETIQEFKLSLQNIKEEMLKQMKELDNIIEEWIKQIQKNQNEQFNLQFDDFEAITQKQNGSHVAKIKKILQNFFRLESKENLIEQLSNSIFAQKVESSKQNNKVETNILYQNEKQKNNIEDSKIIEILFISKFDWEKDSIFNRLMLHTDYFQVENGNKIIELKTKNAFLKIIQQTPDIIQIKKLRQLSQFDCIIFEIDDFLIEKYDQFIQLFRNDFENYNKKQMAFLFYINNNINQGQLTLLKKFANDKNIIYFEFYKQYIQDVSVVFNHIVAKMAQEIQNNQKQDIYKNNFESQLQDNQLCNIEIEQVIQQKDNQINASQKLLHSQKDRLEFKNSAILDFYKDCLAQLMDVIKTENTKYDYFVQFTNLIFYFDSKNLNILLKIPKQKIYQVQGKLYLTEFDENINPKYLIQEGSFEIDLKAVQFTLNGQGIEYSQKSNDIKYLGEFHKGQCKQNQIRSDERKNQQQLQSQYQNQNNQKVLNLYNNDSIYQNHWCKLNQQFNLKDYQIFQQNQWLPSRILDAFVNHLNLDSEKRYFQIPPEQRQFIKRILLMPTTLSTNYVKPYDYNQAKIKFDSELLQYQEINYDLKKVYSKVGFPINIYNSHWYFLLYDLKSQEVISIDSLTNRLDDRLLQIIAQLFNFRLDNNITQKQFEQQNDGYSCGYHVCSVMQYYQEIQFNEKFTYHYNETKIKAILQEIIQQN